MHGFDTVIVLRVFERVHDILQQRLRALFAQQLFECTIVRVALQLFDDCAGGLYQQGGSVRQHGRRSGNRPNEDREDK